MAVMREALIGVMMGVLAGVDVGLLPRSLLVGRCEPCYVRPCCVAGADDGARSSPCCLTHRCCLARRAPETSLAFSRFSRLRLRSVIAARRAFSRNMQSSGLRVFCELSLAGEASRGLSVLALLKVAVAVAPCRLCGRHHDWFLGLPKRRGAVPRECCSRGWVPVLCWPPSAGLRVLPGLAVPCSCTLWQLAQ
jgi:hypothetical protein